MGKKKTKIGTSSNPSDNPAADVAAHAGLFCLCSGHGAVKGRSDPTEDEELLMLPRREARVNGKCGFVDGQLVVLRSPLTGSSVVYPVRVEGKIPDRKCFVSPELCDKLARFLETSSIEIQAYNGGSEDKKASIVLESDPSNPGPPPPPDSLQLRYVHLALRGCVLSAGEPLSFSIGGKTYHFRVVPSGGVYVGASPACLSFDTAVQADSSRDSKVCGGVAGFARVGGLTDALRDLTTLIRRPLSEPHVYRMYGVSPPRGVLLYGPPGTGKTLLASALAEELPPWCVTQLSRATDLVASQDHHRAIHTLFAECRKKAVEKAQLERVKRAAAAEVEGRPAETQEARAAAVWPCAVLFIDEIDALCPKREFSGETERKAVAALLTEMDGSDAKAEIVSEQSVTLIVIGATNRPNTIDLALRRAGRFEKEIEIGVPNAEGRAEILRILLARDFSRLKAPTVDWALISKNCHGFVGADLASLLRHAAATCLHNGDSELLTQHCLDALAKVKPSSLKELMVEIPRTLWSDVGGYEDVKRALKEAVKWPVDYADAFNRFGISPPRGILLYGPPGCAKTMLARAVASESSMNFVSVKGPELFSKWVGSSEQAVRDLFSKARQASPCIVFIDECDAIGGERGEGGSGVGERVLAQLLTELDGVSAARHIVLIGATNRPQSLDPALLRPGRLDRLVYVGLPDNNARRAIFANHLRKVAASHCLTEANVDELVNRTCGYSGAECVMVMKEAALLCIRGLIDCQAQPQDCVDELSSRLASLSLELAPQPRNDLLNWSHVDEALGKVLPRVSPATIEKYLAYDKSISRSG